MNHDYASRRGTLTYNRHRHHRRLGFTTLIFGIFCASGIYASFHLLHDDFSLKRDEEVAKGIPEIVWLSLPAKKNNKTVAVSTSELHEIETLNNGARPNTENLSLTKTSKYEFSSIRHNKPQPRPADPASFPKSSLEDNLRWIEERITKGDSLARIFLRLGLSAKLLHRITRSSKAAAQLARIQPGETLKVLLDKNDNLKELIYQFNPVKSLRIIPHGGGFKAKMVEREYEVRQSSISGIITNSLFSSARAAGLPDALIMDLANIFGWDIDFALEIRSGDTFSAIYEEKYLDGDKQQDGAILAAEFNNRGRRFRAVRFVDEHGRSNYFSPDGKNMRKAFLRAPVDFRRISSKFTPSRWHPVLGKRRPHRGVDYAAKTGTPVKAAGDGKVIYRGRKGGYGKTLIIQHANHYTTLYAHLSKYLGSIKYGSRVKQGDIIGYVGMTGLATGPHLHYEFRVNNVHRNPLTIQLPTASPIAKKHRDRFKKQSLPLLAMLDNISNSMLAEADDTTSSAEYFLLKRRH